MSKAIEQPIHLTDAERDELRSLTRRGKSTARVLTRARVLLKADEGLGDTDIARALDVHPVTVWRTRCRFHAGRLQAALYDKKPKAYKPRRLDGRGEAQLVQLACSAPPDGQARWTLQLLADRLVELHVVDHIVPETVRKTLKKMNFDLT